jgi:predicted nucleic acid-binding Zn ribbon protein
MAKQAQNKRPSGINRDQRRLRWQRMAFVAIAVIMILTFVISLLH